MSVSTDKRSSLACSSLSSELWGHWWYIRRIFFVSPAVYLWCSQLAVQQALEFVANQCHTHRLISVRGNHCASLSNHPISIINISDQTMWGQSSCDWLLSKQNEARRRSKHIVNTALWLKSSSVVMDINACPVIDCWTSTRPQWAQDIKGREGWSRICFTFKKKKKKKETLGVIFHMKPIQR